MRTLKKHHPYETKDFIATLNEATDLWNVKEKASGKVLRSEKFQTTAIYAVRVYQLAAEEESETK